MTTKAAGLYGEAKRIVKRLPVGDRRRLLHEIAAEECGPRDDAVLRMRDALALGERLTRLLRGRGAPIEEDQPTRWIREARETR